MSVFKSRVRKVFLFAISFHCYRTTPTWRIVFCVDTGILQGGISGDRPRRRQREFPSRRTFGQGEYVRGSGENRVRAWQVCVRLMFFLAPPRNGTGNSNHVAIGRKLCFGFGTFRAFMVVHNQELLRNHALKNHRRETLLTAARDLSVNPARNPRELGVGLARMRKHVIRAVSVFSMIYNASWVSVSTVPGSETSRISRSGEHCV